MFYLNFIPFSTSLDKVISKADSPMTFTNVLEIWNVKQAVGLNCI